MRKIHYLHILKIVLLSFLFLSACTIEKRRYNAGYYVDWGKPIQRSQTYASSETLHSIHKKSVTETSNDFAIKRRPQQSAISSRRNDKPYLNSDSQILVVDSSKKNLSKEEIFYTKRLKQTKGGGWSIFFGIAFCIVSASMLLAAGATSLITISGIVIGILGIVTLISGIINVILHGYYEGKLQTTPTPTINNRNIIYLKNGSQIKGQILEEIPNATIKIQTADGSIFVFDMKEVLKITHEQTPK